MDYSEKLKMLYGEWNEMESKERQALAYRLGKTPSMLYRYWVGSHKPPIEVIELIKAEFPTLNLNWFIANEGTPFTDGKSLEEIREKKSAVNKVSVEGSKISAMQMILDIEQQFSEKIEQLKAEVLGKLKGVTISQFAGRQIVDTHQLHAV